MDSYNDVINEDDVSFTFVDDGRTDDEMKQYIDDLLKDKDEYLISLGYTINENGDLVPPDTKVNDGIIGFAVGDALGVPVEFFSRDKLEDNPYTDIIGYGTHYVAEGTWSDDTSMMVATMDSIIDNGLIDYDDLMYRFSLWLSKGEYTVDDVVFDVGISTRRAISKFHNGTEPLLCGGKRESENGNGSLMRMLPVACYLNNCNYSFEQEVEVVNNVSSLTHAHEISCLGCKIYCDYVKQLLNGVDKIEALNNLSQFNYGDYYSCDSLNKYERILNGDLVNLSRDDVKSTGYVVSTLEASLWSMINSNSYQDAVLKAINLGGDTDTIGAITGSMAGILYGKKDIPRKWLVKLKKRDYLEDMSKKFVDSLDSEINRKIR